MGVFIGCVVLLSEALIGLCLMDEQFWQSFKEIWKRVVLVVEQPLSLAAICIVSGVVGLVYFTPVLAVCGILFGAGLHRSGALEGLPLKVQMPIYIIVLAGAGFMSVRLGQKLKEEVHIPTVSEIGDYILNKENKSEKSAAPQPPPVAISKKATPTRTPIEVSVKCLPIGLPISIPMGETIRMLPLVNPWPPRFALFHYLDNLKGSSPKQWPQDDMLALSQNPSDRFVLDCEINNHGKRDILDLTMPFQIAFKNIARSLDVELNPVDAGKPIHIYVANDCRDAVTVTLPKNGKARLAGEKQSIDFDVELEPRSDAWNLNGSTFLGGWGQLGCS